MDFDDLLHKYHWKPIRNCPGRYVLAEASLNLTVNELVGTQMETLEFNVESAPDMVLVASLKTGGIISYRRKDGAYLHTLNTWDGFQRKLKDLGIKLPFNGRR